MEILFLSLLGALGLGGLSDVMSDKISEEDEAEARAQLEELDLDVDALLAAGQNLITANEAAIAKEVTQLKEGGFDKGSYGSAEKDATYDAEAKGPADIKDDETVVYLKDADGSGKEATEKASVCVDKYDAKNEPPKAKDGGTDDKADFVSEDDVDAVADSEGTADEIVSPDLGAIVTENTDGSIGVKLGEDETGSLLALKFQDSPNLNDRFAGEYSLGLYLLPEGAELPIPPLGELVVSDDPLAFIEDAGLTELASIDLGALPTALTGDEILDTENRDDTREEPPQITSNSPIDILRIRFEMREDGDFSVQAIEDETFSPFEEPDLFFLGVPVDEVANDFDGTEEDDFIVADKGDVEEGITLAGLGGDDLIISNVANTQIDAGAGDDLAYGLATGSLVNGDDGDDRISIGANGTAFGGAGDDDLSSIAGGGSFGFDDAMFELDSVPDEGSELYGGAGDDSFDLYVATATGYGGDGNDRFVLRESGATGFGGNDDDFFNLSPGTTADGGAGDDLFDMSARTDQAVDGPAIVTGGEGADVYEFSLFSPAMDGAAEYMSITDFDPEEDALQLENGNNADLGRVRIEEAEDGSYTDVIADYFADKSSSAYGNNVSTAIIRLEGVSGYSLAELVA